MLPPIAIAIIVIVPSVIIIVHYCIFYKHFCKKMSPPEEIPPPIITHIYNTHTLPR